MPGNISNFLRQLAGSAVFTLGTERFLSVTFSGVHREGQRPGAAPGVRQVYISQLEIQLNS